MVLTEEISGQELSEFAKDLEDKIEFKRELLFSYADNHNERKDNEEVLRKEKEGVREFDYKKSISELVSNLSLIDLEKRNEIMNKALNGVNYSLKGVFIYRLNKFSKVSRYTLLADFAENPSQYL